MHLRNPAVAQALVGLGKALSELGEYAAARDHLNRALAIIARDGSTLRKPLEVAAFTCLGNVLIYQGQSRNAIEPLQKALGSAVKLYGRHNGTVGITLSALGNAKSLVGENEEAREILLRVLAISQRRCGPRHPTVGHTLVNLGTVKARLGLWTEARKDYERALLIIEKSWGPDHRHVGPVVANLATAWSLWGQKDKAARFRDRALRIYGAHYPDGHSEIERLRSLFNEVDSTANRGGTSMPIDECLHTTPI